MVDEKISLVARSAFFVNPSSACTRISLTAVEMGVELDDVKMYKRESLPSNACAGLSATGSMLSACMSELFKFKAFNRNA
jgi:hypothetical protein